MSEKRTCATCGSENTGDARFCATCGSVLTTPASRHAEERRVVTVVFADIADSTALATALDPEALRRLLFRYFEEMRRVLERNGGMVEKFIGDAVMAVFGIPRSHEDDALRAVAAAAEMRDALGRLNEEFQRTWNVTIGVRIGIDTGEVVAADDDAGAQYVTGEAVNTAARLQQAGDPGAILLGERTYRLVRESVVAEPLGPLPLKGIPRGTPAWRVMEVRPAAPDTLRRLDSPLVGRERDLARLRDAFERSLEEATVATVMAPAGVGKSRLVRELLLQIGERATVLRGRCLPYGDGITFWPVAAVIRDAAGIDPASHGEEAVARLARLLEGSEAAQLIADRLSALLGLGAVAPGIQETFWAVRKLLEHVARRGPLVVVFDDIHWGEPTFLDLLEYLTDWLRKPNILLVCLARPELLEIRPEWGVGRDNAVSITLRPLGPDEIRRLMDNLVAGAELSDEARDRISSQAEGNPLFVEETLRMLVDDGVLQPRHGRWVFSADPGDLTIPDTIQALLTARLDRLTREERATIERASVAGRVFSWGELSELSPADTRPRLAGHLQSLLRKELIRPDYSESTHEDSFRFAHILVRDAAYRGLAKSLRAELHERLASWFATTERHRAPEYEELAGYHFEQAHGVLAELGVPSASRARLAEGGATLLGSAGQRAFARGDMPAAVKLLSRAVGLLETGHPQRAALLPDLAFALMETGDFERLAPVVEETKEAATASNDPRLRGRAIILDLWIRLFTSPEGWTEEAERAAAEAIASFRDLGDERGLSKAWSLLGLVELVKTQFAPAEEAWTRAAEHAHNAGDHRDELESAAWIPLTIWAGPTPSEEGIERCRALLARVDGDKKAMSSALVALATFEAGIGRFDEARELVRRARALLQEVSLAVWLAGPLAQFSGWVELLADDPAAAERELRAGYEPLREMGELAWLSTVAAMLAEAVRLQGRDDEAEQLARIGRESAGADDVYSQTLWRTVLAKIRAGRAEAAEAESLAREAVEIAERSDFLHLRWHALVSQAEVLAATGRASEASAVAAAARQVARDKGSRVAEEKAAGLVERASAAGTATPIP